MESKKTENELAGNQNNTLFYYCQQFAEKSFQIDPV
jgi:hypothetical protein